MKTRPWSTAAGDGVPIWECYPKSKALRIREAFEERAAIMEYDGGLARHTAELFAYSLLVEALWDAGTVPQETIHRANVVVHMDRAARIHKQHRFEHGLRIVWGMIRLGLTPDPTKKKTPTRR